MGNTAVTVIAIFAGIGGLALALKKGWLNIPGIGTLSGGIDTNAPPAPPSSAPNLTQNITNVNNTLVDVNEDNDQPGGDRCDNTLFDHISDAPYSYRKNIDCVTVKGFVKSTDYNSGGPASFEIEPDGRWKKYGDRIRCFVYCHGGHDDHLCMGFDWPQLDLPRYGDRVRISGTLIVNLHNGSREIRPVSDVHILHMSEASLKRQKPKVITKTKYIPVTTPGETDYNFYIMEQKKNQEMDNKPNQDKVGTTPPTNTMPTAPIPPTKHQSYDPMIPNNDMISLSGYYG